MDRCALFVDAGYLLADGAMAVHGTRHRETVSWDFGGLLQLLGNLARERTGMPLLRCYWYESTVEGRRSPEHEALADLPGLKLRLGRIRPGRREGVDTEVHRDLMALSRNGAIADAIVVSGDEDLAQVITDAQDLGIRVTVVHVSVDGNWTISRTLRQECDDLIEIGSGHLRPYVTLLAGLDLGSGPMSNGHGTGTGNSIAPLNSGSPYSSAPPSSPVIGGYPQPQPQLSAPTMSSSSTMSNSSGAGSGSLSQSSGGYGSGSSPYGSPPMSGSTSMGGSTGPIGSPGALGGSGSGSPPSGPISQHPLISGLQSPVTPPPMPMPSPPQIPPQSQPPSYGQSGPSYHPALSQPGPAQSGPFQQPMAQVQQSAPTLSDAVKAAHQEGQDFGESVARDAPALWLEAVLARKPRMPSDLEARLLQGSSLPIDFLLHDEVRHALRRGFWDALERSRR